MTSSLNAGAPRAHREPVERTHHGHTFVDNYEWLRNVDNPAVMEHIDAENAWFAEQTADQRELCEQLVAEIQGYTKETDVSVPVRDGDYWYWTRTWEGRPYGGLFRVPLNGGKQVEKGQAVARPQASGYGETRVYDGNVLGAGEEYFATGSEAVSPNGKYFALAIDTAGDEQFKLRIHDIDGDIVVDDAVTGIGYGLGWLADSSGVFYTRTDDAWRQHQVWLHKIGTHPDEDVLIYQENDELYGVWVDVSRDGMWAVISAVATDTTEYRLVSTADVTRQFTVFERRQGLFYSVEPAGEELLIIHNANEPGFELATAPVAPSVPEDWITVVAAGEGERLLDVEAFRDFAALTLRSGGGQRVRVLPRDDDGWGEPAELPIAETMTVHVSANRMWDAGDLVVAAESITQPLTWMSWDVCDKKLTTLKTLEVPGYNPGDYVEYRLWAPAKDGTEIPVTVAHRADLDRAGKNAGYVYGYGSYEVSMDPYFTALRLPILSRGLVVAFAHVRGGGEMGRHWYEDGRLMNKKNTFTDFVDATRFLVESGLVEEGRIAAEGRSAGGLLMGAVANLAPELYRVIHAGVPFVDALTTMLKPELPLTVGEWEEWGNPLESAEVYEYMAEYSPYENIRSVRYPAILATTSLNDIRVSYVEPTKWVQRLRDTVAEDSGLIVQHTEKVAGHFGGSGRYRRWEQHAKELAFMFRQLGVA